MKFVFIVAFVLLLYSCNNNQKEVVTAKYPDGKPAVVSTISVNNDISDTIKRAEYYSNGKKKTEGSLKNNFRDGMWTYWYDNGNMWSQGTFLNGKSNGKFNVFNKDGTKYMQSEYKNGVPDGKWTFFQNNKISKEVIFQNGKQVKESNF